MHEVQDFLKKTLLSLRIRDSHDKAGKTHKSYTFKKKRCAQVQMHATWS